MGAAACKSYAVLDGILGCAEQCVAGDEGCDDGSLGLQVALRGRDRMGSGACCEQVWKLLWEFGT